jgi:hypothetical protein
VPLPVAAPPTSVGLAVVSDASRAEVLMRGQRYDLPLALEVDVGSQPELVEVSAPGRQGRRFWLRLDQPTQLDVRLERGRGVRDATPEETLMALGSLPQREPASHAAAPAPSWTVATPPAPEAPPLVQAASLPPAAPTPGWAAEPVSAP